jgi:hypothetical protein
MISDREIDRGMATLRIIWLALMMSLVIYGVVGGMAAPGMASPMNQEDFAVLRIALFALSLATLLASRYIKRLIMTGKGRAIGLAHDQPPAVMQRYTGAVIASLAMSESVGIYGLVLYLLGKDETDLYLLLAISALAMVYHRPKREELADL